MFIGNMSHGFHSIKRDGNKERSERMWQQAIAFNNLRNGDEEKPELLREINSSVDMINDPDEVLHRIAYGGETNFPEALKRAEELEA